jgi:peptidyl-dipeptidase Dcp
VRALIVLFLLSGIGLISCSTGEKSTDMKNPLLTEFQTPFGVPPFDQIKHEHFAPAAREAMKVHEEEMAKITASEESPTFENTIEAMEYSGALLDQVSSVFSNLNSSLTSPEMQQIAQELAPELSAHRDAIRMNADLFARVKAVYDMKDELDLNTEQSKLLEETYKYFVRGGANLPEEEKEKLRKINEELSVLSLKFGQNILKETNDYKLVIENEEDLSGLPEGVIAAAAETATELGEEDKWVFTVQKPSMLPFLTYADNRDLRKELHTAFIKLGDNDNEYDNKENIKKIVKLRADRARILGYDTHAHFVLEENMAKTPDNVYEFLYKVWEPGIAMAKKEAADLQKMIYDEGNDFELEHWDWWYYSEKVRKARYDLDEETISQYFVLENVRDGAFKLATNLFGLKFEERSDIPKYHEDVQVFEVKDADGSHIGVLYMDWFPRASKRAGAWMSEFRGQKIKNGKDIRPVVTTNFNFTKPTKDTPALLTTDEVLTTFHEFGHALHGLLSKCTYGSLAGTSVSRDFVELPSQIMENWALEPEILATYASHYQTGEVIPDELVEKIKASGNFNQGFTTAEYMAASFLDMDYHTLTPETAEIEVNDFENKSMEKIGLIEDIIVRYRSTYFSHVFSGGYSSGYYSYLWAEVLDSDAFNAFKETGNLYDPETAIAYRTNILEKGGTEDPMKLYKDFRGQEPDETALLRKRGLLGE